MVSCQLLQRHLLAPQHAAHRRPPLPGGAALKQQLHLQLRQVHLRPLPPLASYQLLQPAALPL